MEMLSQSWGSFVKFKVLCITLAFDLVESAASSMGLLDRHKLQRPSKSTGFSRALAYLSRVCDRAIPFLPGSSHLQYKTADGQWVWGDKNPTLSLKVESIKRAKSDASIAYRVNISDRLSGSGDMAHVLTAVFDNGYLDIQPGTDHTAWSTYGADLTDLIQAEYDRFCQNYNDEDVRGLIDSELKSLRSLQVLGRTTNFVARPDEHRTDTTDRAMKLTQFIKAIGHEAAIMGLDGSEMSRDALVDELKSSILAELDAYDEELDEKLGKKTDKRARGEGRRQQMYNTATTGIERIMGLAEYHATVLNCMAEGVREKADALRAKALRFLTDDFSSAAPSAARVDGAEAVEATESVEVMDAADPFAGV